MNLHQDRVVSFELSLQVLKCLFNRAVVRDGGTSEGAEVRGVLVDTNSGDEVVDIVVDFINLDIGSLGFNSGFQSLEGALDGLSSAEGGAREGAKGRVVLASTGQSDQVVSVGVNLFLSSLQVLESLLDGAAIGDSSASEGSQVVRRSSDTRQSMQVVDGQVGLSWVVKVRNLSLLTLSLTPSLRHHIRRSLSPLTLIMRWILTLT